MEMLASVSELFICLHGTSALLPRWAHVFHQNAPGFSSCTRQCMILHWLPGVRWIPFVSMLSPPAFQWKWHTLTPLSVALALILFSLTSVGALLVPLPAQESPGCIYSVHRSVKSVFRLFGVPAEFSPEVKVSFSLEVHGFLPISKASCWLEQQ